jgi:Guanylate-binding protein, N-terminal domain/Guanylate-binding protein, C-terminal domain
MDPIQFISTGELGHDFELSDEALKILDNETRPVTVICIVGPYRTGKSYLLNRLMGKNNGFPLGPTLQAKTKGIWMWVGDYFGDPSRAMVLLDTEGLDDPEKGNASHDMNMFAISLLLSSVFIFNTKGTIDAKSLDGLHYATEISSFISADSKNKALNEGQNLSQHFPSFIWAIRDHHLKLEINGEVVTSKEYLEFCLKNKPGFSPNVIQYNGLRDALRAFFKERTCFVFPPPVSRPDKMNFLETIADEELAPGFRQAGNEFVAFVKENARPKMIKGSSLSGRSFGSLAKTYIKAVLDKNICIESTYQYVIEQENGKAIKDATLAMETRMKFLSEVFPIADQTFTEEAHEAQTSATAVFLKCAVNIDKHPGVSVM